MSLLFWKFLCFDIVISSLLSSPSTISFTFSCWWFCLSRTMFPLRYQFGKHLKKFSSVIKLRFHKFWCIWCRMWKEFVQINSFLLQKHIFGEKNFTAFVPNDSRCFDKFLTEAVILAILQWSKSYRKLWSRTWTHSMMFLGLNILQMVFCQTFTLNDPIFYDDCSTFALSASVVPNRSFSFAWAVRPDPTSDSEPVCTLQIVLKKRAFSER